MKKLTTLISMVISLSLSAQANLSDIIKSVPDSMKWGWSIGYQDGNKLSMSKFFENPRECQSNLDMIVNNISQFYKSPNSIKRKDSEKSEDGSILKQSWDFGNKGILLYERHDVEDGIPIHYLSISEF